MGSEMCIRDRASDPRHLAENAAAAELQLSADDLQAIDSAYPAPTRKQRLQMV